VKLRLCAESVLMAAFIAGLGVGVQGAQCGVTQGVTMCFRSAMHGEALAVLQECIQVGVLCACAAVCCRMWPGPYFSYLAAVLGWSLVVQMRYDGQPCKQQAQAVLLLG
jgi:hypothetical protein